MKPALPFVSYEVTMNCNLKCRFCYNHYKNTKERPLPSSYSIANKTLRRIFKTFDVKQLTFTGGEPFMAERFGELVLTARLKGATVGIISNGNYADPEKYLQLTKLGIKLFELPIHSYKPEIHDFMTRTEGSHQKSVKIISSLQEKGIEPVAVIVLTKYNADNASETIRFINSLGIKKIMLNRYNIGGEGVLNPTEVLPSKDKLQNAFKEISDEALKSGIQVFSGVCTPHCILRPQDYKGITFTSCSFDFSKRPITIDYLGNVRFCNHSPVILGNIYTATAEEILACSETKEWEKTIPDYCKNCRLFSSCKAGCRAATQQCGMSLDKPDPLIFYYEKEQNNEA